MAEKVCPKCNGIMEKKLLYGHILFVCNICKFNYGGEKNE